MSEHANADPKNSRTGRHTAIIATTTVVVAGVLGAGAFAVSRLAGGGPQPAEVVPADAIAYVSVDLDPSASQKLEAVKLFKKFPALEDKLADAGDDLRETLFDKALEGSDCSMNFKEDVEPWLGNRVGLAAIPDADSFKPMVAIAVTDPDAATKGVQELLDCSDEGGGVTLTGDYLVVAEDAAEAKRFAAAGAAANLADTDGFQTWSDEVGDLGIMNFYVAKSATEAFLAEAAKNGEAESLDLDSLENAFTDFEGAAGTLRFAAGGMEVEVVSSAVNGGSVPDSVAGELVGGLPEETGVSLAVSVPEALIDRIFEEGSKQTEFESGVKQLEDQMGLSLPEDIKTLFGDGFVLALGGAPDDLDRINDPSDVDAGLAVDGDVAKIGAVVDKLERGLGQDLDSAGVVRRDTEDRFILATNEDFAAKLGEEGTLGDSQAFTSVVPEGNEAQSVFFVNLNSSWTDAISEVMGDERGTSDEVSANLEPMKALGFSTWQEGNKTHFLLRASTD